MIRAFIQCFFIAGNLKLFCQSLVNGSYYVTIENQVTFTKLSPYELNFDELKRTYTDLNQIESWNIIL